MLKKIITLFLCVAVLSAMFSVTFVFETQAAETKYKSKLGITVDNWMASLVLKFANPYDNYKVLS